MPKLKTPKCVTKRMKVSGKNRIRRRKGGHSHLMSCKGPKRRRQNRRSVMLEGAQERNYRKALHLSIKK